ncbi:restriction endonuclease subunit R [Ignatzschineria ureiclastica]|uniref:Restriction endonuclease subunit R n=1 Tax=Ignatzschineria ureiclastica TaxID=472582 RepID=A0A2U2ACP1_9GAMM|nr:DEAD/DEAH box helicase family protein [Ignatzschineria ureiclastica]PWD80426.1 restriction endonuclease subunit R [Ignatzschineria ureiclastica]GGZ99586.1 DEAD/DEAH box helicase [Ignatzschineria ureiclastica]
MKIKFKQYPYQLAAVNAVVDCFEGQPFSTGVQYRVDPGTTAKGQTQTIQQEGAYDAGFRNAPLQLKGQEILANIQKVQQQQYLKISDKLISTPQAPVNLDIEMETGTGKTYVYIRTIFELNRRYGWNKFIIMVPSIAIREGVYKSFQMTKDHFLEAYHKQARFFIYNSSRLNEVEAFSTDAGINVMIMNIQAFNSKGKDNRRIYDVLDSFQSRRPIDVIKANNPILILDEPQKMEGKRTMEALEEFNALAILRYSATHKTENNLIHRLDAVDAYNQKLVKRISVRGITLNTNEGTHGYLYLEGIDLSSKKPPVARLMMEVKSSSGNISRVVRKVEKGDNLYALSGEMEQYKSGYLVTDIEVTPDYQRLSFENGVQLSVGEATGDVSEEDIRRIQIRETIRAHFEKEPYLFKKGIKTLSLFFIDEVVKYRDYEREDTKGLYARMFEEEYQQIRDQYLSELALTEEDEAYHDYLKQAVVESVHKGYFSIDKQNRLVDPSGKGESTDANDYDLILKDKERLLSFNEPTRFIFSHSALREGWDNPNVFTLCTLKHSDNTISRRQEIGRGLRISVNQQGERQDDPAMVHDINVLDVVANESYESFASSLQSELLEELKDRPRTASVSFFKDRRIKTEDGTELLITEDLAEDIMGYLRENDYIHPADRTISDHYQEARKNDALAPISGTLAGKEEEIAKLVDQILDPNIAKKFLEDSAKARKNRIKQHNLERKEFQALWNRINRKAIYQVKIDTESLINHSVTAIDQELRVRKLEYVIQRGMQNASISDDDIAKGSLIQSGKVKRESYQHEYSASVKYDLLGKIAQNTYLTRETIATILSSIESAVFAQFAQNPEDFITQASRIINQQKARIIINQVTYNPLEARYETALFTDAQVKIDSKSANGPLEKHVLEYAVTDSQVEKNFIAELEKNEEVVVYAKLPSGFKIPTPVGDYNPDWAITFKEGSVKYIYFVAETKGTTSTMEIRGVEAAKIECARRFFNTINPGDPSISYGVVKDYATMLDILRK